jgi:hypothetical protein
MDFKLSIRKSLLISCQRARQTDRDSVGDRERVRERRERVGGRREREEGRERERERKRGGRKTSRE